MTRSMWQNKQLHALLSKLKIDADTKKDLVLQFTNNREESTKELMVDECQNLINYLNAAQHGSTTLKKSGGKVVDVCDKMRKKILSICHDLQWELPNGKIDWKHLNDYLNKYGYLHKPLNDYTEKELPTLVTQFENLLLHATK